MVFNTGKPDRLLVSGCASPAKTLPIGSRLPQPPVSREKASETLSEYMQIAQTLSKKITEHLQDAQKTLDSVELIDAPYSMPGQPSETTPE